ncbi:U4/U6.U5 tri-snRNP-associated protein 1-like, partial [Trifolium medium]|nr:U4/U6.U5 tri-snRNP-associated protein 1-like [Trifolium medium]
MQRVKPSKMNNKDWQFAYAKAVEACKLLRPEQSRNVKTPVFADDDEDLR